MPTIRPGGPWAVQWSHPLARGLRDAVIFDTPQGQQLVPFGARPVVVGNPSAQATAGGRGMRASSGTNYVKLTPEYTFYNATEYSFSFIYHAVTIPGAYTAMVEFGANTGSDTGRMFSLFINTSGNINYLIIGGTYIGAGLGLSLGIVAGQTYRFTFTKTANTVAIYRDSTLLGTVTDYSYFNTPVPAWYLGYNVTGGGQHSDAIFTDLFVWHNRALTAAEVALFADNPWPLITPQRLSHPALSWVDAGGSSPITGSGAATLGALTSAGVGTLDIAGTGAATLGAVTADGVGTLAIAGTAASTLGALTGTAAGTLAITAAGAATLGAVTAAGAGTLSITGAAAPTLGILTGAAAATLSITGSGAVTLGALTVDASSSDQSTGTAAVTLGALTGAGVGTLAITGAGAATLGAVAGAGAGTLSIAAAGAGTLGLLTGIGVGGLPITGSLAVTLGALTGMGTDAARVPAPASRTYTWPVESRGVTWPAETRAAAWPAQSRTVVWRG